MHILEQRFLRGPNVHADSPCLLSVLSLDELYGIQTRQIIGFNDALLALLPSLHRQLVPTGQRGGFALRLKEGTLAGRVVEQVTLELQTLAGAPASYGRTRPVTGQAGLVRIVCEYRLESVAQPAFRLAVDIVDALAHGEAFDLAPRLDELSAIVARHAIGPGTAAVLAAADERGVPYQRITEDADLFQLGWGVKQKRLQATTTSDTSFVAVKTASDRQLTKALLAQAAVPVPAGETVDTLQAAREAALKLGGPVVVKPLDPNQGKGVTVDCRTADDIGRAFAYARKYGRRVLVERFVAGRDYRVLVAGGRVAAASLRRPAQVVGDGLHSIAQLVEITNGDPRRGNGHGGPLTSIVLDAHAEEVLRGQGFVPDSVPADRAVVLLRANANPASGGAAEDVTALLPEATCRLCVRAAAKVGLDVARVDIVCRDIAQPLDEQDGAVIEVYSAPAIHMHQHPGSGEALDAGAAILDSLIGNSDGRIPLIAVTGTNGKTTTTLLIRTQPGLPGAQPASPPPTGSSSTGRRWRKAIAPATGRRAPCWPPPTSISRCWRRCAAGS